MERFVYDWVYDYIQSSAPLHSSQHGFQHAQFLEIFCTTQLLEYFNDLTSALDGSLCVDVVYLDFSKAFDKISHSLLLLKLQRRGLPSQLVAWIASFLANRRQRVVFGSDASDWAPVTSGVPQGSVLGPLLFNIFVDDIDDVLHPDVKIKKFADDTKLYVTYRAQDAATAALNLQHSLDALLAWCDCWLMQLNFSKCNVMYLGNHNPHAVYSLNEHLLVGVSTIRDLGITVSDSGRPSQHCSNVAATARRLTGLMLRTFRSRKRSVIVPILTSIIRPVVEYATPVWNPCLQKDIAELESVQRKVTKCIDGLHGLPYTARLQRLQLPTLATRRLYYDMLECYKIVHKLVRSECAGVLALSAHRTRGFQCKVTSTSIVAHSNVRKHFFVERALSEWNALPDEVVQKDSYGKFKLSLRNHLKML
jgi:hypothetical protein